MFLIEDDVNAILYTGDIRGQFREAFKEKSLTPL